MKTREIIITIILVVSFIAIVYLTRYTIESSGGVAYKLDRWTGQVYFINAFDEREIKMKKAD